MKEAVTKVIDTLTKEDFHWGLSEVVGTVQKKALQPDEITSKGLEFHVCTINKNAHTKKSGNLSYAPRIYSCLSPSRIWLKVFFIVGI